MANNAGSSTPTDRKTIEKNRRDHMKILCSQLNSLVPNQDSQDQVRSLPDQFDGAINYIGKLEKKLERLKEKKHGLMAIRNVSVGVGTMVAFRPTKIEIHSNGSALEVILIGGMNSQSIFYETIRVLHQEGAVVINASSTRVDERIFHTIHSQVGESSSFAASAVTRISIRLHKLVHGFGDAPLNF